MGMSSSIRPSGPTAALALLLAGNRRHVDARSAGTRAQLHQCAPIRAPVHRPFAAIIVAPGPFVVTPELFAARADEVVVLESEEAARGYLQCEEVKLGVVAGTISGASAHFGADFEKAESRVFATIAALLRSVARLRDRVSDGDLRVVAALIEETTERVHWIGEHPDVDLLVRDHARMY